jgi:serine-type D-Ala-D-Ala carboxypeptidase (penicillin-binding protein 5/6)
VAVRIRAVVLAAALAAAVHSSAAAATPSVDARAYEVVNAATGEVLLARNAQQRVPMASITKLMTVLVALERTKLDEVVTVDRDAVGVTGSGVRLRAGERITVRDLMAAAMVQSANDAAIALAAHVGRGDEDAFVALMNRKAQQLGLRSTHFERADGLDVAGHASSAHDVNRLAQIAMRQPVVRELALTRGTRISGGRSLHTWNDLLGRFPGLIGVKTGHTSSAGWCQVAAARGPGFTIYATILGSPSRGVRNADLTELLAFGLSQYRLVSVISAERTYARAELPYGRDPLRLVAMRAVRRPARVARPLTEQIVAPTAVSLPVREGQRLGEVHVYDRGRLVASSPLVASRSVARPGTADKVGWYAKRTLHHLGGFFS